MKDERRTELPEWARYVAIDGGGNAWAFEVEPEFIEGSYHTRPGTRFRSLGTHNGGLRLSDDAVRRLVFPLTPPTLDAAVSSRAVGVSDAKPLRVTGTIGE